MINYVSRRICIRYKTPFHPDFGNEFSKAKVRKSLIASAGFKCKSSSSLRPVLPSLRWLNHCCFDVPCVSLDHRSLNIKHSGEGQCWTALSRSLLTPPILASVPSLSRPPSPHPLPHFARSLLRLCIKTTRSTYKSRRITTRRNSCGNTDVAMETYLADVFLSKFVAPRQTLKILKL